MVNKCIIITARATNKLALKRGAKMEIKIRKLGNGSDVIIDYVSKDEFWAEFQKNFDAKYKDIVDVRTDVDFEIHESDFKRLMPSDCILVEFGKGGYGNYFMHELSEEMQDELKNERNV